MPKFLPDNRKLRLPFIFAVILVLLVGGVATARWFAIPHYRVWREQRSNEVARNLFRKGDLNGALLAVRKSLMYNPQNVDAWRLGVEIAEKQNTADVVFYQQHLSTAQPTLENKVKFIRVAIKFNAFGLAFESLSKVGAEGAKSPEFLELAALVCRRVGNQTRAKYYLMSLVSLRPDDTAARFDLAQIRLFEGVAENKPAIRAEIRAIANDSAFRVRGLTLLLAESLEAKNSKDALELADQLAATAEVSPPGQIFIADTYRRFAPAKSGGYIKTLEELYVNDSSKVVILLNYLAANDMAAEARRWTESLNDKTRGDENVQLNYAYALLLLKDWPVLDQFLHGCKWTENEFARHALLAYRFRENGSDREFNEEWKLAMIDVGNNQRKVQTLLAQAASWNWEEQKYELLWKRFMIDPHNVEVRQALAAYEVQKGRTANLNRLFARLTELDPKDNDAKNNFAYTSILLGVNMDRAYQMAEEVYNSNPKSDYYATTYSLALYRQGKSPEALKVLQGNGTTDLSFSVRPLLLAVYLAATGKIDDGTALAKHVDATKLLPEERRLMSELTSMVEKAGRTQNSAARLASFTSAPSGNTSEKKSWLATLPPALRKTPSINMELADSLYTRDDFAGLETTLRGDKWEPNDFLRLSLLAYAQRGQQKEGDARSTWHVAMSAAGNQPANLRALAQMSERWNWPQERIEILTRIYQRDPTDLMTFNELTDYYNKNGQTVELARIYDLKAESNPSDADAKSRFAYYSLLTGSNLSKAHVMAKDSYDAMPENPFRAKVYAFSLLKQSRAPDAARILEKLPPEDDNGQAQLSLLRAATAVQQKNSRQARTYLDSFKPASALPEESALADSLTKTIAKDV